MQRSARCSSSRYLPSAVSSHIISPRVTQEIQSQKTNSNIYNKFMNFLTTQHISLLKKKLLDFRGTHLPINYKSTYNFQQRWEKNNKVTEQASFNILMSDSQLCYFFSFIVMVHNFFLIWFLSVFRIYEIRSFQAFFIIAIIFIVADLLIKVYLFVDHYKKSNESIKLQTIFISLEFITLVLRDIWCLIYYILILADTTLCDVQNNSMLPFDFVTIIFLVHRAYEIYNYLVILIIATKYKNEMTIFDLAIKMICILHCFSLLLYGVALTSPQSNWMTRISMEDTNWDTRYIYTLYFACTTMLTVGYGDILPTNKAEIITIMVIQALGMALFGYIVNEIGAALGNMRKRRTNLQRDIYNSQRISKLYELNSDLGRKVRDYVISNQIAQQELGVSEENDFLLKLNQQLRQQVKESHQLKIVKTSIFFITHWSKKIQIEMAKKLQKVIFAPNQNIHTRGQIDKLFVMVKGKIEIYTQKKFGTKMCCRKLLKTIQKNPGQQVFNNVYGFTSFFTGKPNQLKAIAKQSTICYTLGYEDIRDAINQDSNDFQYFHYLRQKFQFAKIPEKLQTSNIVNIRQNYSPIIFYLIKKYTKLWHRQSRHKFWTRNDYINKRVCELNFGRNMAQTFRAQSYDDLSSESQKSQIAETNQNIEVPTLNTQKQCKTDRIMSYSGMWKNKQACLEIITNSNQMISNRSYRRKYWNSTQKVQRYEEKAKQFLQDFFILTSEFEIGKNYNRFYAHSNKKIIVQKLNKKPQLIQQDYGKNSKDLNNFYKNNFKRTIKRNFTELYDKGLLNAEK